MMYDYPKTRKEAEILYPISQDELTALLSVTSGFSVRTTLPAHSLILNLNDRNIIPYVRWTLGIVQPMRLRAALADDLVA